MKNKDLSDSVDELNSKLNKEEYVLLGSTTDTVWKNILFDKSKYKSITLMCCNNVSGASLDSVTIPITQLQTYPINGEISVHSIYAIEPQYYHAELANISSGVAIKSKSQYDKTILYGSLKL